MAIRIGPLADCPAAHEAVDGVVCEREMNLWKSDDRQTARGKHPPDFLGHALWFAHMFHDIHGGDELEMPVGETEVERILDLIFDVGDVGVHLPGKSNVVFIDVAGGELFTVGGNHGVIVALAGTEVERPGKFPGLPELSEVFPDKKVPVSICGKKKFIIHLI